MWRFSFLANSLSICHANFQRVLKKVPAAPILTRDLVFELCDRLRDNRNTRTAYIQAEEIAKDLDLERSVDDVSDFGSRDTFAFEERGFLRQYIQAVAAEDFDLARGIEDTHRRSIWVTGTAAQEWR